MEVLVAEPHGMCSGVARALEIARQTLEQHPGQTLWCFHELVHNEHIVAALQARGMRFVNAIAEIPEGARVLFSAHGVSPEVRQAAALRCLEIVDATCPFVAKVHAEARRYAQEGCQIALIGHKGHDEVVGILGEAPEQIAVIETCDDVRALRQKVAVSQVMVLSQTTISEAMYEARIADLQAAGFEVQFPKVLDICYATRERQQAVRALAQQVDCVLVLGSRNSSNSKRLVEVAERAGCRAALIASPEELETIDLLSVRRLGLTSGASTPESLLDRLRDSLNAR
ncbi:MAG: 4-hydroxy-3-methylbut-2-enyl diphosphate reductase [Kiritimatiellae bacterium]|nr:4-hydroxy-3-methylbut-2-enyl diphosphate reductase [Kiritimatiellia bacterium]